MLNLKRTVESDTYFAFGEVTADRGRFKALTLSVAAFSDRFRQHELVDAMLQGLPGQAQVVRRRTVTSYLAVRAVSR